MIGRNRGVNTVRQNGRTPRGTIDMRSVDESGMNITQGSMQGICLPPAGLAKAFQRCLLCGISLLMRKRKSEGRRQVRSSSLRRLVLGWVLKYHFAPERRSTAVYEQSFFSVMPIFSESAQNHRKYRFEKRRAGDPVNSENSCYLASYHYTERKEYKINRTTYGVC